MLSEQGTSERIDVRLSAVLERMDLTSGAAYNIWGSQDEFQNDLAAELATNFAWAGPDLMETSIDVTADPIDELRRLADQYFDAFTSSETYFMTLRFWGVKEPSNRLSTAIRDGYALNREAWADFYGLGIEFAGRRFRSPFTIDDLVAAITATTEGCAIRHRFEPDPLRLAEDRHLYSEILVAVLLHFTEPIPTD